MPKFGAAQLALIVIVLVGAATALVIRLGWLVLGAAVPAAVALAALWALASVAIARLSGRPALLSTPALAAFVLSVAGLVLVEGHHRRYLPLAAMNAVVSAGLVAAAIQFDRRPRT